MVLNRRLEYGFNGYQVPAMPRAARSARRRSSIKKKGEDSNMCAFDLLAAVAGKLLVGKDSSFPSSSNLSTKQEAFDQGSCVKSSVNSHNTSSKEITDTVNKKLTGLVLEGNINMTSDGSTELDSDKLMKDEAVVAGFLEHDKSKSADFKVAYESKMQKNVMGMYSLGNPVVWDAKPLAQIKSDSAAELSLKETEVHRGNNVELVDNRDDDENSSGCTHRSSSSTKSYRSAPCVGDRRIRKVLASKYWKVAKKWKGNNFTKDEVDLKTDDKEHYKNLPPERNFPFKKRKFFDLNTESNSEGEVTGDGSANWASSSMLAQHLPCQSSNPHVRLRIGSFKVPELFIEIPETATIGSLKRAVVEAVTSVLGGELRVGILLQGKKVGDDSKTLLQTGISHDNETDLLSFTLEPSSSSSQDLPLVPPMAAPPLLHSSASQSNLFRSSARERTNLGNSVESDRVSATSPADVSNRTTAKVFSKAIVPVSSLKRESLSVVPIRRKPQSEMAQRRVRRPFSVAEVEALVQAVEKLGTGRWRDVKLRAFDSAKHRTYVDLKDKWKTLVHTARISPQQRRGEPVPQELLDRVLTAHAYWSQHQAKHHLKHHPQTCLLL